MQTEPQSQYGFARLPASEKAARVSGIFDDVAGYYDRMNDLMSGGLHRLWKRQLAWLAAPRPGDRWLDLAGGSGDIAALLSAGCSPAGAVVLTDPSARMLALARRRLAGRATIQTVRCAAESLPFPDGSFSGVACAFGLRNFTDQCRALTEIVRVLEPGGRLLVLEFAQPRRWLRPALRAYLLHGLPAIGRLAAGDSGSYRYLGESILAHPPQPELAAMMRQAGLQSVDWIDLAGGIAAVHHARRATWT